MTKKRHNLIVQIVTALLPAILLTCSLYLNNYYPADMEQITVNTVPGSAEIQEDQGNLIFAPAGATTGLIFYPGGKVDHNAYIPLMQSLSARGIFCVLVDMPFRLAVFDINAAENIPEQYPHIQNWYIAGHSLGGAMASAYLSEHADNFRGLVLLGAYSTADLSGTDLSVLSIYGSEDQVMNRKKYEECMGNYPADFTEYIIEGGCHSQFGMYGSQEGDGIPSISGQMQIAITSAKILEFIPQDITAQ